MKNRKQNTEGKKEETNRKCSNRKRFVIPFGEGEAILHGNATRDTDGWNGETFEM